MIVIGIIAILVALLFPVVMRAGEKAKEKQAQGEARTILLAIKAYQQEYGRFPGQYQAVGDTNFVTNNGVVIQALLGSNVQYGGRSHNPKGKVFLSLQVNTNTMVDPAGNYLDPWGIPYLIGFDQNGDYNVALSFSNSYAAFNPSGRQIGSTNLYVNRTNDNCDACVASFGGTSNSLPWNTWDTLQ